MTIPKIFHQMWLHKEGLDLDLPEKKTYQENIEKLKELNPDFEYVWWNNSAVETLFTHPDLVKYKDFYDKLTPHICKCDFARYALLYIYGGIYFDLDFKYHSAFPKKYLKRSLLLCHEPDTQKSNIRDMTLFKISGSKMTLANNVLGSEARHHFWLTMLDSIVEKGKNMKNFGAHLNVVYFTGPFMLSEVVIKYIKDNQDIVNALNLVGDNEIFFGRPLTSKTFSYNDWRDGTGWETGTFRETGFGQLIIIFGGMLIFFVIILAIVIVGLSLHRCNHYYNKTLEKDSVMKGWVPLGILQGS